VEAASVRTELREALEKAAAARSSVEALRLPTLALRRPVACSWKPVDDAARGLLTHWRSFVASSLDPMGLEGSLPDEGLPVGSMVRLNVELPGEEKATQTLAEVTVCKRDLGLPHSTVRFAFVKLPVEARDRLVLFLMETIGRGKRE
jgi:hypothetical protein